MRYQISVTRYFSAAHALRLYDGSLEPVHGHNWRVTVTVESPRLDAIGVVMDFHELERLVATLNPSAENVAVHVSRNLPLPSGVRLVQVEVWETPECRACVLEE
jgi:6-pyruvoyl-tetrahydropterin synthase